MTQQPPKDDDGHPPTGRLPEWVVVTWVNEQLRDRIQRNGGSLAEALQAGTKPDSPADSGMANRAAPG